MSPYGELALAMLGGAAVPLSLWLVGRSVRRRWMRRRRWA